MRLFYSFTEYFNNDLDSDTPTGDPENAQHNHIQFLITEVGPKIPKSPKTTNDTYNANVDITAHSDDNEKEILDDFQLVSEEFLISPQIFCQVFPFHLMFNRQMKIVQAGKSVLRVIPKLAEENCNLLDILEPIRPHIQLSFRTILSHITTIYVLKTKPGMMLESDMFMRLKVNDG